MRPLHMWESPWSRHGGWMKWSVLAHEHDDYWSVRIDEYRGRTPYVPGTRIRCDHYAVLKGTVSLEAKMGIPKYVADALRRIMKRGQP